MPDKIFHLNINGVSALMVMAGPVPGVATVIGSIPDAATGSCAMGVGPDTQANTRERGKYFTNC